MKCSAESPPAVTVPNVSPTALPKVTPTVPVSAPASTSLPLFSTVTFLTAPLELAFPRTVSEPLTFIVAPLTQTPPFGCTQSTI